MGLTFIDFYSRVTFKEVKLASNQEIKKRQSSSDSHFDEKYFYDYFAEYIQFDNPKSSYNRALKGQKELLHKAFGLKVTSVFDLTAGLAEDAWTLARLGYQVQAFEQHQPLCSLLNAAYEKVISKPDFLEQKIYISFTCQSSYQWLNQFDGPVEACYIDPMFEYLKPPSALPKKHMQLMRLWIGADNQTDVAQLFDLSFKKVQKRVVVKRPHHLLPIRPNPSFQVLGRSIRFDVYVKE